MSRVSYLIYFNLIYNFFNLTWQNLAKQQWYDEGLVCFSGHVALEVIEDVLQECCQEFNKGQSSDHWPSVIIK